MGNLCTAHPTVVAFIVRDIISLNDSFRTFSLVKLIKLTMYLKICYRLLKEEFYVIGNSYLWFLWSYVPRLVELQLCLENEIYTFVLMVSGKSECSTF